MKCKKIILSMMLVTLSVEIVSGEHVEEESSKDSGKQSEGSGKSWWSRIQDLNLFGKKPVDSDQSARSNSGQSSVQSDSGIHLTMKPKNVTDNEVVDNVAQALANQTLIKLDSQNIDAAIKLNSQNIDAANRFKNLDPAIRKIVDEVNKVPGFGLSSGTGKDFIDEDKNIIKTLYRLNYVLDSGQVAYGYKVTDAERYQIAKAIVRENPELFNNDNAGQLEQNLNRIFKDKFSKTSRFTRLFANGDWGKAIGSLWSGVSVFESNDEKLNYYKDKIQAVSKGNSIMKASYLENFLKSVDGQKNTEELITKMYTDIGQDKDSIFDVVRLQQDASMYKSIRDSGEYRTWFEQESQEKQQAPQEKQQAPQEEPASQQKVDIDELIQKFKNDFLESPDKVQSLEYILNEVKKSNTLNLDKYRSIFEFVKNSDLSPDQKKDMAMRLSQDAVEKYIKAFNLNYTPDFNALGKFSDLERLQIFKSWIAAPDAQWNTWYVEARG